VKRSRKDSLIAKLASEKQRMREFSRPERIDPENRNSNHEKH
jgi:hypothetical protein